MQKLRPHHGRDDNNSIRRRGDGVRVHNIRGRDVRGIRDVRVRACILHNRNLHRGGDGARVHNIRGRGGRGRGGRGRDDGGDLRV